MDNGGCNQNCINTIGSYHCSCNSGYILDVDLKSCNGKYLFIFAIMTVLTILFQISMSALWIMVNAIRIASTP